MFANEKDINYFGTIDGFFAKHPKIMGGANTEKILEDPDEYNICDGWMISFTTDEQNIREKTEPDLDTGNGRIAIKTELTAAQYYDAYFSGKNKTYQGEEPMIPQEYFALFAKSLYEKYIKKNKKLTSHQYDFLDSRNVTWFISTYLPNQEFLPNAGYDVNFVQLSCSHFHPRDGFKGFGVRSVVRRNINK